MLPRLAGLSNGALWLHFAEQAVAFERGLAPLRGLPMPAGSDELAESTEEPWTDGSCLELLARQPVGPWLPVVTLLLESVHVIVSKRGRGAHHVLHCMIGLCTRSHYSGAVICGENVDRMRSGEVLHVNLAEGSLRVQAWCTGWWNAEREEALRQLDDILDAEAAWQPAPALWGSAPSDGADEPSAEDDDDEPRHAAQ